MDYVRILTDSELAQAESEEGEILTASSPHESETESEEENPTGNFLSSVVIAKSHPTSAMQTHFSQERRKRTFTDMFEDRQEDQSSLTIPNLKFAFESEENSFVSSFGDLPRPAIGSNTVLQNPFLHPGGKFSVDSIREKNELNNPGISEAFSSNFLLPENLKKFRDWNAIQKKHNKSTAIAMKAMVACFVSSPPTSMWDFDPFKLPIKLAKNDVESYKRQISSRHCLRDLVKVVDKEDLPEVSHVSTVLSLIPLNAIAFNRFDSDISAEGMKMLAISSEVRKMIQTLNCKINEMGAEKIYANLSKPSTSKPARSRPSIHM